jgi:hypothetical protein
MLSQLGLHLLELLGGLLESALYAAAGAVIVLGALVYIQYRRLRRDGRWDRVVGAHRPGNPAPRRALDRQRHAVNEARATATGALAVIEAVVPSNADYIESVSAIMDAGSHLSELIDLASGCSDDAIDEFVTALNQPVTDLQDRARHVAEALAAELRARASLDINHIDEHIETLQRTVRLRNVARYELVRLNLE